MTLAGCFSLNQGEILFSKSYFPFFRFKSEILPLRIRLCFLQRHLFCLYISPCCIHFTLSFLTFLATFLVFLPLTPFFISPSFVAPSPPQYSPSGGGGVYFPQIYRHRSSSRRIFHQCPRHNFGSFFPVYAPV